jgi:hypothetical protein
MEDFITLPKFIAWLKTKPKDEEYSYLDNQECLVAQYAKAQGWERPSAGPYDVVDRTDMTFDQFGRAIYKKKAIIPSLINQISQKGYTFGGALKLAKKAERDGLEVGDELV